MTQDDAHIFCTKEQMGEELTRTLQFVLDLLRDFGLNDFYLELSTRPPARRSAPTKSGTRPRRRWRVSRSRPIGSRDGPGGGAFYDPRSRSRPATPWPHPQMSTVQLDFQTPQRFDATYVAADNTRTLPIMIHRPSLDRWNVSWRSCSSTTPEHADLALSRTGPGPGRAR